MKKQIIVIALVLNGIQLQAQNVNIVQVDVVKNSQNVLILNQNIVVVKQREYPIDNCINESWVHESTRLVRKGVCEVTQPLSLETISKFYPKMGMSFNVQYWNFAVVRADLYRMTYRRYITNVCVRKQLSSNLVTEDETNRVGFQIKNPNLSDKTAHSYDILPLTEGEAQQAVSGALSSCNQ